MAKTAQEMNQDELQSYFNVQFKQGLSKQEAAERLQKYGPNELTDGEKKSSLKLFLNQFKDFMVYVLMVATVISGFLGETADAIAIIAIVIINAFLGYFQEKKAEKSLQALKNMSAPQMVVLRGGEWIRIPSKEAVFGDIVRFTAGDRIGADLRIISQSGLEIEESALTGESIPVSKDDKPVDKPSTNLGDQTNLAFMGTMITRGSGMGVIVATGMKTAMGQIAEMLETSESGQTPLQHRLEQLGKILIVSALLLTLLVVSIGIYHGNPVLTMVLAGVSLAVAAIPEGLPAIVTVALSLGVQRMIKQRALVRKLPAVETLGCASVICSDKTGTMTENKMTVTQVWTSGSLWDVTGVGYMPNGEFSPRNHFNQHKESLQKLLEYGMICNQATLEKKDKQYVIDGDPTDGAMLVAAMKYGLKRDQLLQKLEIIKEFPFDSNRKRMSVLVKDPNGRKIVISKGAPDLLVQHCINVLWNGRETTLHAKYEKQIENEISLMNGLALRTIAVAYKIVPANVDIHTEHEAEKNLTFLGIQGMFDPPRPEVKMAIRKCREAGIKTVMITGDHKETALSIAKHLDIVRRNDQILTGSELDQLSDRELKDQVENINIFARVTPEHKLRIVKAFQSRGHIVAMTGDGVNDAPAIKKADIGISMGITGTDVAKETASLILLDDHFATIKAAIQEGRNIYENIRKFIRYLLASNVGEILVMLIAMIMNLPLPLIPIQILWINLVTDGLPAMALGLDKPEENVMKRPPRHPKEGVFARGLGWKIISRGVLIGISTIFAFILVYRNQPDQLQYAQTVAFVTLILAQLIHVFDCRSEKSIFSRNPFGNMYLVWAVLSSLALMFVVLYYPPLQKVFHTMSIKPRDWLLIGAMACMPTFLLAGSLFSRKSK
ncbi:MAG: calcium-translocating P-type ATPase, SERCA-type [Bacillales bacterium]|jgi:Ca2+-transporting ATPase|nr:calcium-translocating P-type ATPase, SERCA-type [Bacillales bacterium]